MAASGLPQRVRIKVCGLTRAEDARAAVDCGADAVGMIFYPPSPRAVDLDAALRVAEAVPAFVTRVGVFVDPAEGEIEEIIERVPLDLIQFHGAESPQRCERSPRPYVKVIGMREGVDLDAELERHSRARAVLLDTFSAKLKGGTGQHFDWRLAQRRADMPIILAGGLSSDNVAAAIEAVRPYAVDVNGGVERSPGIKDAREIERFVNEVERVKVA